MMYGANDDICNVIFLRICDVTKQNDCAYEGTLYREPLGETVVHYDNVYKILKRVKVRYIQYNRIHMSVILDAFKIFGLL